MESKDLKIQTCEQIIKNLRTVSFEMMLFELHVLGLDEDKEKNESYLDLK